MARRIITNTYQSRSEPVPWMLLTAVPLLLATLFLLPETQQEVPPEGFFFGRYATLPGMGTIPVARILTGLFFIVVNAFSLQAFHRAFSPETNIRLPLLYLLLALTHPLTAGYSPLHVATPMIVWSLLYFTRFKTEGMETGHLFCSLSVLCAASFFWAPLFWFAAAMGILALQYNESKLHCLSIVLAAVATMLAVGFGVEFLTGGLDAAREQLSAYFAATVQISPSGSHPHWIPLTRNLLLVLAAVWSMASFLGSKGKYRILEARLFSTVMAATLFLVAITALFSAAAPYRAATLLFAPSALLVFFLRNRNGSALPLGIFTFLYSALVLFERLRPFLER